MDILQLIKRDHEDVKALFKEFAATSDRAKSTRAKLASKIIDQLDLHTRVEEDVFYSTLRERLKSGTQERTKVLEGFEEHAAARDVMGKIEDTDPKDETYVAKMEVLRENVEHHVKEEESVIWKIAKTLLSKEELTELGQRFQESKARAEGKESVAARG